MLLGVGQSHQVIQTDIIEDRQFGGKLQGKGPLLSLILGIQGLIAHQKACKFLLLQVPILPQITDS